MWKEGNQEEMKLQFLPHFRSKRTNPLRLTIDEIAEKIQREKLSTYDEFFKDGDEFFVKPYFDSDARYYHETDVNDGEKSRVLELFKQNVCKVMDSQEGFSQAQLLLGERHGFDVKHPERPHKISFRAWILGWKVKYPMLKQMIIDNNLQGDSDGRLDDSVYKASDQLLGCVYACKGQMTVNKKNVIDARILRPIGQPRPYKDYLVQHLEGNEKMVVWKRKLDRVSVRSAVAATPDAGPQAVPSATHENLADLLDILVLDRVESRSEWVNIAHHLKAISATNFEIWDAWSQKSQKYTSKPDLQKVWNSICVKAGPSDALKYLYSKAKFDNEEKFIALIAQDEFSHVLEILHKRGSHLSIAKYIELWHKYDILVVSAKKQNPLYYTFNGNTWDERDQVTYLSKLICESIIPRLQKQTETFQRKDSAGETGKMAEQLFAVVQNLENHNFRASVIADVLVVLYNGEHIKDLMDANTDLIGFGNGVYDLRSKEFRPGQPEDFVTRTTKLDCPIEIAPELTHEVEIFLNQILVDQQVREYLLDQFSQNLNGRVGKNLMHFLTGSSGANGKTTLVNLVAKAFGDYAFKVGSDVLTSSRPSSFNGNPLLMKMKGVRFIYIEEPEDEDKSRLNGAWIKELTGGAKMSARLNHGNQYFEFMPQWHFYALSNKIPELNGSDGGLQRRVRKVDFEALFTNEFEATQEDPHVFPEITDMSDKLDRMAPAFLRLLLNRYIHDFSYECPEKVLASSRILMEENDPFAYFVNIAIRRNRERNAYFTVKEARKVWKELAKGPDNEILRSLPKESDLSSNLSRLLRLKCIPQTWITNADGSKHNARSVFRNVSLQFEFDNEVLVARPTD